MKALKFGLVVLIFSMVAMGYADNDQNRCRQSHYIKISLADACSSRSFVKSIYQQTDQSILRGGDQHRLIWVKVRHRRGIYLVFGKYKEWEDFFIREGGMLGPPNWRVDPK